MNKNKIFLTSVGCLFAFSFSTLLVTTLTIPRNSKEQQNEHIEFLKKRTFVITSGGNIGTCWYIKKNSSNYWFGTNLHVVKNNNFATIKIDSTNIDVYNLKNKINYSDYSFGGNKTTDCVFFNVPISSNNTTLLNNLPSLDFIEPKYQANNLYNYYTYSYPVINGISTPVQTIINKSYFVGYDSFPHNIFDSYIDASPNIKVPVYDELLLLPGASGSLLIDENYKAIGIYWGYSTQVFKSINFSTFINDKINIPQNVFGE